MPGTISGTTLPGAGVSAFSQLTDAFAHAIADGAGNYSITGLTDDTYEVTSNLNNYSINTVYLHEVISGGNTITGVNFTGTLVTDAPTLVTIDGDTFIQPNGPLNPAWWTLFQEPANPGGFLDATVVSNEAQNQPGSLNTLEFFTKVSWPSNAYAQCQVDALTNDATVVLLLRSNGISARQTYWYYVADNTFNNPGGTMRIEYYWSKSVDGINFTSATLFRAMDTTPHITLGSVMRAVIVGNRHFLYMNGNLIGAVTDNSVASGIFGGFWLSTNVSTDGQISHFSMGSASLSNAPYSVPDDRNFSVFPNTSRSVQNTETYDVPLHPSTTPPADSRAAGAPVDSRTAGNIPQNSRTPGTFGPGE